MNVIQHASDNNDSNRKQKHEHDHRTEINTPGYRQPPPDGTEYGLRDSVNCMDDLVVRQTDPGQYNAREKDNEIQRDNRIQNVRNRPEYIQ
jgi:hypothetical protein